MSATGMTDEVAQGLRFLAKYQRADGKNHARDLAVGRPAAVVTDFPYTYYHADTTPVLHLRGVALLARDGRRGARSRGVAG